MSASVASRRPVWRRETFRDRLTAEQLAAFTALARPRNYLGGVRIAGAVGLIRQGVVIHEQYSDALSELALSTTFCGEGDLIGLEEAFLDGGRELSEGSNYRAHSMATVLEVPYESFRRFAETDACMAVMREQAARTRRARADQARAGMSVRDKLGTFLLDLARRFGHQVDRFGVSLGVHLTQDQIARAIGVSRPAVEKELKWLRDEGYVWTSQRLVILTEKFMDGGPRGTWCT